MKSNELLMPSFPFQSMVLISFVNFLLIILMLLLYCSSFAKPAGLTIQIPKISVSENGKPETVIKISAENVFYLNERVVTFNELKKELVKIDSQQRNFTFVVDRRAQMGRVMDVWGVLKSMGNSQVNITADQ